MRLTILRHGPDPRIGAHCAGFLLAATNPVRRDELSLVLAFPYVVANSTGE
jgi:hypothetical protein